MSVFTCFKFVSLAALLGCTALAQGTVNEVQRITVWRRGENYAE